MAPDLESTDLETALLEAGQLEAQLDADVVRLDFAPPQTQPPLPVVHGLLAGAAEVDITPPPGMPKAGHSSNSQTGTGFRTRLHAHVLHLRAGRESIAIVQCDLLAGSPVVQRLVADALAGTDLRLSGLFLGATHTHAGPGQFHGSEYLNAHASNHAGFDPAWTSWLVRRIAEAVLTAVATRRPARLATGATQVWGLTRNRSHEAYVRNVGVVDKRTDPQRKYVSVNPWLHLIRVDAAAADGGFEPLAAAVVFSVHGTGISQRDRAYNADVWAYLKGELAHHIEVSTGHRAVVGAMEGTHGDVAPAVRPDLLVYPEAERVGRGIGAAAAELYDRLEGELSAGVELAVGFREIDLRAAPVIDGITLPAPAVGAALLAGATENRTPVLNWLPPFRPNVPKPGARGPHGAKWIPGGRALHDRIIAPDAFGTIMPLHLLRIGALTVLGVPFEVTVEAGRRVEAAVAAVLGGRVAISSLANDQLGYLTTAEEYSLQRYEGGHTLFGPMSQRVVTACAAALAADVMAAGGVRDAIGGRHFELRAHRYLARASELASGRTQPRLAPETPTFTDPCDTEDGYWTLRWSDVAPGDLHWHEPLVRVEVVDERGRWRPAMRDGRPVDDQGYHLGVFVLGPDRGSRPESSGGYRYAAGGCRYAADRYRYAARWYAPPLGGGHRHRFVLLANAGRPELNSRSFD